MQSLKLLYVHSLLLYIFITISNNTIILDERFLIQEIKRLKLKLNAPGDLKKTETLMMSFRYNHVTNFQFYG